VLRLEQAEHAFKTPSLREIGRRAPYMHDGSLPTLADVLRHYQDGIVDRPTLASDLPRTLRLSPGEQSALLAFLATLTSESDPQPPERIRAERSRPVPATRATSISQLDRAFTPSHVRIRPGDRLWFLNNDTRTHNIRIFDRKLDFDSGAQEPGETVQIAFPQAGSYLVFCGIHPKMELTVDVTK
jgi:cytochrome c peroxidase